MFQMQKDNTMKSTRRKIDDTFVIDKNQISVCRVNNL